MFLVKGETTLKSENSLKSENLNWITTGMYPSTTSYNLDEVTQVN